MEAYQWDHVLFVEHPELYLPILIEARKTAKSEVNGLLRILKKYGVNNKARVLDLFCGIGRHSVLIAKKGYSVIGYDPSELFLEEGKKCSKKLKLELPNLRFVLGSPFEVSQTIKKSGVDQFDVIMIMSNCLGFRNENFDLELLKDIYEIAKRNCIIIVEIENRDWRIRNFESCKNYSYNSLLIQESWRFDMESSVSTSNSTFYEKNHLGDLNLKMKLKVALRLYSLHELIGMFKNSGWLYVECFDNLAKLGHADLNSQNMIVIGKKL